jgi:HEAT repeat protein
VASDHDDTLCREAAIAALGSTGDQAGLSAIFAAMDDKPTVRRRAVIALAAFDGPAVEAALRTALSDRDWQVRQAAEDLIVDASAEGPDRVRSEERPDQPNQGARVSDQTP